ncbi:MAG: DUF883 family protein [Betaproteobacteria bacterium]|nr:DUF883 family protein [Betaproteobacteria bacterium]
MEHIAAGAHGTVDRLAGAATQAVDTLDRRGGQLRGAQAQFTESCRGYVRENPLASLGIAVTAGFLLSWLLKRR